MTLADVVCWLKEKKPELTCCLSAGGIDGNNAKWVGVYGSKRLGGEQRVCIGGPESTGWQTKRITILVHWTNNIVQAEQMAQDIHQCFYGVSCVQMGSSFVISADPGEAPYYAGKDTKGISEYVVEVTLRFASNREKYREDEQNGH